MKLSTRISALFPFCFSLFTTVLGQTTTSCNPLLQSDCPADLALGTSALFNWTSQDIPDGKVWDITGASSVNYASSGAQFSLRNGVTSQTIKSHFYMFSGRVSIVMQAASGAGVVSSIMLLSDDLDEIDWEWVGGNTTSVQTNFFGKGDNTTTDRARSYEVDNTLEAHNYTIVWDQDQIQWMVDDNVIRTLLQTDPSCMNTTVGDRFPQTPLALHIGPWAGGDSSQVGTSEWAGGKVDWSKGPYTQTVISVEVVDGHTGSSYAYGDQSGTFQSINVASGNSTVANRLGKPQGTANKFNALPKGAKIAILAGILSIIVISLLTLTFCCIRNRRQGRKERLAAEAAWNRDVSDMKDMKHMITSEKEIHGRMI